MRFAILFLVLFSYVAAPCPWEKIAVGRASWRFSTYEVSAGSEVGVYRADTTDVSRFSPELVEAFRIASERFTAERPELPSHYLYEAQKKLDPRDTEYFVLKTRSGLHSVVRGLGLMVEGSERQAPIEREFPEHDFRAGGKRFVELARLGIGVGSQGGLRSLFSGMAARLREKYGVPVPQDLDVVLWTKARKLADDIYTARYGFEIIAAKEDRWALRMSAREFLRRFEKP